MAALGQPETVPNDSMSLLSRLAAEQAAHEREVAALEEDLKLAKAILAQVAKKDIPELMDSLQLETFTTRDGLKIEIKEQLRYSVPQESRDTALDWLEENDLGGSLKRHVAVEFGVDDVASAQRAATLLKQEGWDVLHERRIEPATLGKILRESLAEGIPVPLGLFGAWRDRFSKITHKKES